jgi:CRP/FNR family transcriptional regulator, cyclic AMP receptor protein
MKLDARIQALEHGTLFASVPEADLAVLAESMNEEAFRKDETVCAEGEPADRIFVVMAGKFQIRPARGGDRVITLGAGDLFGEYGLFDQGLRTATIMASEPGTLLTLDYPRFRSFLLMFPEAMLAILGTTVGQLLAFQRGIGDSR